ncbi:EAL domain-containing protein, partial [Arsukibacterium sp.]|uniref:EAL domain-containing protein n=1 Tax=Arsukibacterium sp. TaxID=1977258 RepID=UPI0035634F51
ALTQTIAQIAKTLDMQITAEGVETEQMLQFCQSIGCDFIQGYYFYKPMPAADFYALVQAPLS